jgi:hypothetical protein
VTGRTTVNTLGARDRQYRPVIIIIIIITTTVDVVIIFLHENLPDDQRCAI